MTSNPTAATIDRETLLPDLQRMIKDLKADLLDRLGQSPNLDDRLRLDAFDSVERAGRTAQAYEVWRLDYLEQVAVAWVLACVFARYMEDNGLIAETYLAGITPDRRRQAEDAQQAYLNSRPDDDTDRGYLLDVFRRIGSIPAARDLFAEGKTPLWALGPTADGARVLLDAWRKIDPETGALLRSFRVEGGDTRFLGDLYQDLSEEVRKKYALLQTPDFVERFLLDHTLTPALDKFGLAAVRTIDPTCGSGHLVLGSFWRLFHEWERREPATDPIVLAQRALDASCGVDINPFAVAITRFRLAVAAIQACQISDLRRAPGWTLNVAAGDSLVLGAKFDTSGRKVATIVGMPLINKAAAIYAIEEPEAATEILGRQYHVVVGNPPYITVKDAKQNEIYRSLWKTCHRQYSLSVPFIERFFDLALRGEDEREAGFVGMITANSFMKREFGKKLIVNHLCNLDLTHVIDSSMVHLPGHGSFHTVILFGRNRRPSEASIRAVRGIRREHPRPTDPATGLVWKSIVELADHQGSYNDYVTVVDASRESFSSHPWSIGGGGAAELIELLDRSAAKRLGEVCTEIGFGAVTREDDAYQIGTPTARRHGVPDEQIRSLVGGDDIRDWQILQLDGSLWPYSNENLEATASDNLLKLLWPVRILLSQRVAYGLTQLERGNKWFEYSMFFKNRFLVNLSISFAAVTSGNHFVFDRGGHIFKQSAPVIKLPSDSSEEEHLSLLGILNSSIVFFWMSQVFQSKGGSGDNQGVYEEAWEYYFDISGTGLQRLPLPSIYPAELGSKLDGLARNLQSHLISLLANPHEISLEKLAGARSGYADTLGNMISLQENLDWLCYSLYGLIGESDRSSEWPTTEGVNPVLRLGERAFEIAMARQMAAGELQTSWFERHGSTPITEIPGHWPESYRALVQRRLDAIRDNPNIALIERPEYKRRWNREPWDDQVHRALKSWLLDRIETAHYWPDPPHEPPELASCAALAERAGRDADFLQVAALYAGRPDFPLARLVEELITAESVPLLPVLRYKPSGMVKRMVWERTWGLQRREDNNEDVGPIPVPPRYASADFLNSDLWRLRGKLDVPKERFVSYPHASRDGDPSLVVGWAGWDHLRQAQALTAYYERMKSREGWTPDRLVPLLAGLDQLVPWLIQWHNDLDPEYDLRMGDYYRGFLADEGQALGFTLEQVRAWTPPAKVRGPGGRKKKS